MKVFKANRKLKHGRMSVLLSGLFARAKAFGTLIYGVMKQILSKKKECSLVNYAFFIV